MNHTSNYNLSQWEAGDRVQRSDFNADNAKIDAALAGKAEAAALTALTQTVNKKGNCQIVYGQYVGDGTFGDPPKTLTFDKKPLLVIVAGGPYVMVAPNGYTTGQLNNYDRNTIVWSGNSVSWYSNTAEYQQLNQTDVTYYYLAFLEA